MGLEGAIIGLNRFGASAPGGIVMRELGFLQSTLSEFPNLSWPATALSRHRKSSKQKTARKIRNLLKYAPQVGLEPTTLWLTRFIRNYQIVAGRKDVGVLRQSANPH